MHLSSYTCHREDDQVFDIMNTSSILIHVPLFGTLHRASIDKVSFTTLQNNFELATLWHVSFLSFVNEKEGSDMVCIFYPCSTPFPNKPLQYKSFENTVGKGEIARNEQFLPFPQRFLPIQRTSYHFRRI